MNKLKEIILKFWEDNKVQLFESMKAAGRYLVFLVVGWVVTYVGGLEQTQGTIILFSILTFIDKWLHENWKSNDNTGVKGIAPF